MPKKIVLATIGSLGDVHPFIALGQALQNRGFGPVLALPKSNVEKVERAGLRAEAIFPSFEQIGEELGMGEAEATMRMLRDPDYLIRRLILHYLSDSTRALEKIADGASAIACTQFALSAQIIADAKNIPLIPVILQPMLMMSPHDPPLTPDFWMMRKPPVSPGKLAWNRFFLNLVTSELKRRYAGRVNRERRAHGLTPRMTSPIFPGPPADAKLVLGLYPEAFAPRQPDYPANVVLTGFSAFDSDSGAVETLDPELDAFLSDGDPPLIFTLGSFAVYAPGDFYRESAAAARALGRRALLLTGPGHMQSAPDVLVRAYAPHSLVFPRAAAIIHHGGIGTTGTALRSGKPQLVVPYMGDQADHGARIVRLGLGGMIPSKRYSAARASDTLGTLLADSGIASRAEAFQHRVTENGADRAAEAIALALA
jgi:rhamnosyltransferase subunit B